MKQLFAKLNGKDHGLDMADLAGRLDLARGRIDLARGRGYRRSLEGSIPNELQI